MEESRIVFGLEAIKKVLDDATPLYKAVSSTLGAGGRNTVALINDVPVITKDGVSVAKLVEPYEKGKEEWQKKGSIGGALLREASDKTNTDAGDGTTSTIVLAYELIAKGLEAFKADEKLNQVHVANGIRAAASEIVSKINDSARKVDEDSLIDVCMVSSNGDEVISHKVVEVIKAVGVDGAIKVENSNSPVDEIEIHDGIAIKNGWFNNLFSYGQNKVELDNPFVLVIDDNFDSVDYYHYIMQFAAMKDRDLLVVAHDFGQNAIAMTGGALQKGLMKGRKVMFVKSPFFMDKRFRFLSALSSVTGGTLLSKSLNNKTSMGIKGNNEEQKVLSSGAILGKADNVVITNNMTVIKYSGSDSFITNLLATDPDIGNVISGKVATIHVGGHTEVEQKERFDRYEDTLSTARSAIKYGVVVGAGMSMYQLRESSTATGDDSFSTGVKIMYATMDSISNKVAENAGYLAVDVSGAFNNGSLINVQTNKLEDLTETRVIDSAKAVTSAIENASSLASTILTLSTYIK